MSQAIPAYVINLDRRPDRWATISENLERIGVTAERIAVDARLLEQQERNRARETGPLYKISLARLPTCAANRPRWSAFCERTPPRA